MKTIATLIQLEEQQLFDELGRDLAATTFGAGELPSEDVGRSWFAAHLDTLRSKVCGSNIAEVYRQNPAKWDNVMLIAAISDLVAGAITGVSPVTVAALIVKKGIEKLCP